MATVTQLDSNGFEAQLSADGALLVDFFADWCMPCKMMAPVVEKLADAFAGQVTVAKVNVDEEPELAQRYGIQSIPALLVFQNGIQTGDFIGVRPYEELDTALRELLSSSAG